MVARRQQMVYANVRLVAVDGVSKVLQVITGRIGTVWRSPSSEQFACDRMNAAAWNAVFGERNPVSSCIQVQRIVYSWLSGEVAALHRVYGNHRAPGSGPPFAPSFIVNKEKGAVPPDYAAKRCPELVESQRLTASIEEISCLDLVVAEKLIRRSVEAVRA